MRQAAPAPRWSSERRTAALSPWLVAPRAGSVLGSMEGARTALSPPRMPLWAAGCSSARPVGTPEVFPALRASQAPLRQVTGDETNEARGIEAGDGVAGGVADLAD